MFSIRRSYVPAIVERAVVVRVGSTRVGAVHDSDVKVLDDEIAALSDKIAATVKSGGSSRMADLSASHLVFVDAWRQWLVDEDYDENLKQPWYRSSTLGPEGEKSFEDFKSRERAYEAKYEGLLSDSAASDDSATPPPKASTSKSSDRSVNWISLAVIAGVAVAVGAAGTIVWRMA